MDVTTRRHATVAANPNTTPRSQTLQYRRADEATDHCAAPVEADVPGGNVGRAGPYASGLE